MMKKLKIYIGCSLTQAPKDFKNSIVELKKNLRARYQILDFIGLIKGTPRDVFIHDTNCVKSCDLFVAICTYPSIGLGYEIGVAISINKPILALAHADAKITRILLGINHPSYKFERYNQMKEVPELIKDYFKSNYEKDHLSIHT